MKQSNRPLSSAELEQVERGKGSFNWPLPNYEQLLSTICGFLDGMNGKKHKGSC